MEVENGGGDAATFMPPRGRPTLVVLSLVASSSVASLSSASSCDGAAACRSLALSLLGAALPSSRRIFWPLEFIELSSRKDDSSDAH